MERREENHHCSIAKQTILTTHPSGLQTRVSVELANFDSSCTHECKKKIWDPCSPFLNRRILGSAHATPVLGRRSDMVNEGRLSQQCTPVMRRRELLDSPGGSPMMMRRELDDEASDLDNAVISGWLKFRDNKRWKSRWGVVTKLSPAAGEHEDVEDKDPTAVPENGPSNPPKNGEQPTPQSAQPEQLVAKTGQDTPGQSSEVVLDPELLSALGASTSDTPEFGDNVHDSLALLWTPLLKKGLQKEDKIKLTNEYLIPGNCKLLQAPKLNAEISAAVSEVVRGRDKKLAGFQQQLGTGTSAVNRAMDTLLTSDNKILALKHLSDCCRILTDLHHTLTKDRIKLITPSLDKNFIHVIQDAERDETLFGNALSDKIKASKAIQRQGTQIRKFTQPQKTAIPQPSVSRPAQGNWSGPSRYPSNRGGRGGQRRPMSTARRSYPPPQTQTKSSNQSKARAAPPL